MIVAAGSPLPAARSRAVGAAAGPAPVARPARLQAAIVASAFSNAIHPPRAGASQTQMRDLAGELTSASSPMHPAR